MVLLSIYVSLLSLSQLKSTAQTKMWMPQAVFQIRRPYAGRTESEISDAWNYESHRSKKGIVKLLYNPCIRKHSDDVEPNYSKLFNELRADDAIDILMSKLAIVDRDLISDVWGSSSSSLTGVEIQEPLRARDPLFPRWKEPGSNSWFVWEPRTTMISALASNIQTIAAVRSSFPYCDSPRIFQTFRACQILRHGPLNCGI